MTYDQLREYAGESSRVLRAAAQFIRASTESHTLSARNVLQDIDALPQFYAEVRDLWNQRAVLGVLPQSLLREPLTFPDRPILPPLIGKLLDRVRLRRGTDQIRKLRGERPQDEPWPWIHEGELIAALEELASAVHSQVNSERVVLVCRDRDARCPTPDECASGCTYKGPPV